MLRTPKNDLPQTPKAPMKSCPPISRVYSHIQPEGPELVSKSTTGSILSNNSYFLLMY